MPQHSCLEQLPGEILLDIANRLDLQHLRHLVCSSRFLHRTLEANMYRTIKLNWEPVCRRMLLSLCGHDTSKLQWTKVLDLGCPPCLMDKPGPDQPSPTMMELLSRVMPHFTRVQTLRLNNRLINFNDEGLLHLFTQNLKRLIASLPSLQAIEVFFASSPLLLSITSLEAAPNTFTLISFTLGHDGTTNSMDHISPVLTRHSDSLHTLALGFKNNSRLSFPLSSLRSLRRLEISRHPAPLPDIPPTLHHLKVAGSCLTVADAVQIAALPALRTLTLDIYPEEISAFPASGYQFASSTIHTLKLGPMDTGGSHEGFRTTMESPPCIAPRGFAHAAIAANPDLREIAAGGLTDKTLALLEGRTQLRSLELYYGSTGFPFTEDGYEDEAPYSAEALVRVATSCPNLTFLRFNVQYLKLTMEMLNELAKKGSGALKTVWVDHSAYPVPLDADTLGVHHSMYAEEVLDYWDEAIWRDVWSEDEKAVPMMPEREPETPRWVRRVSDEETEQEGGIYDQMWIMDLRAI